MSLQALRFPIVAVDVYGTGNRILPGRLARIERGRHQCQPHQILPFEVSLRPLNGGVDRYFFFLAFFLLTFLRVVFFLVAFFLRFFRVAFFFVVAFFFLVFLFLRATFFLVTFFRLTFLTVLFLAVFFLAAFFFVARLFFAIGITSFLGYLVGAN